MNLDWKWTATHAKPIPEGKRVVLKMADKNDEISLALAQIESGQLLFIAQENPAATLPVYWFALPE